MNEVLFYFESIYPPISHLEYADFFSLMGLLMEAWGDDHSFTKEETIALAQSIVDVMVMSFLDSGDL
jgi:hypothetical protein